MEEQEQPEQHASVPPTPIPPAGETPQTNRRKDIGIGIAIGLGLNILGGLVFSVIASLLVSVASLPYTFQPVFASLAWLLIIGGGIGTAYYLKRRFIAIGMFISLGIIVGVPLLLAGFCAGIVWFSSLTNR